MNIPVNAKIGRKVECSQSKRFSSPSTNQHSGTNISIHNVIGAGSLPTLPTRESSEPVLLATPADVPDSLALPSPLITSKFEPDDVDSEVVQTKAPIHVLRDNGEVEVLAENIGLKRFRKRVEQEVSVVIDVNFLRHVIKTLLVNHHITPTADDMKDILAYFVESEVRIETQPVKHRGVKMGGCCSDVDVGEVVEVGRKYLVDGVNLAKKMPRFLEFLGELLDLVI
jgi:hypothetical protein